MAVFGGTRSALEFTGINVFARCEVVHSENSLTITVTLANVRGVCDCSFCGLGAEAMS